MEKLSEFWVGNLGKMEELGFGARVFENGSILHARVVIFAAVFVLFTLGLSSYLVFQHLSTYNEPSVSAHFGTFSLRSRPRIWNL